MKEKFNQEAFLPSIKIAALFLAISGVWIIFSDSLAQKLAGTREELYTIQAIKGFVFIIFSTLLIYLISYFRLKAVFNERAKLRKTQRSLKAINKCNHILVRSREINRLISESSQAIVQIGGYTYSWGGVFENGKMIPYGAFGLINSAIGENKDLEISKDFQNSPYREAILEKRVFYTNNLKNIKAKKEWLDYIKSKNLNSIAVYPLIADDDLIGVFTVYSYDDSAFEQENLKVLEELSEDLAYGIKYIKLYENAAKLSEDLKIYRQAIESTAETIYITDNKGVIEYVNPAFEKMTGYSKNEAIGKTPKILQSGVQNKMFYDDLRTVLNKGEVFSSFIVNKKKNGEFYHTNTVISPIKTIDGKINRYVAVQADITELFRIKESLQESNSLLEKTLNELKSTQNQVIQQERLRALGEMASGIVHDFNNTLQPILGNTELLLMHPDNLNDKARVIQALTTINTLTLDASYIVGRLREFYRPKDEMDNFQPIDLAKLVNDAFLLSEPKWKDQSLAKGITIETIAEFAEDSYIAGNEAELREVFINFIFNSVDALPDGGYIKTTTKIRDNRLIVQFSDNGIGMTPEEKSRCMEPFYSTKGKNGTGLGLAIIWGIVRRHEGIITLESEKNNGATFTISFPLLKEENIAVAKKNSEMASKNQLRILIVDDEPSVREIISLYLSSDNHEVIAADNPFSALEIFQEEEYNFDIVFTDKAMPKMNGEQFASMIKALSSETPVILLSGYSNLPAGPQNEDSTIDYVLLKPVTLNSIREAIRYCLNLESNK